MNKKLVITLLILTAFTIVAADDSLFLGHITPTNCVNINNVTVNGSLDLSPDEYYLTNCTDNNNTWNCNCSFDFYRKINAVNNYTLTINYVERIETNPGRSSGGSGYKISNLTIIYENKTNTTNTTLNWTDYIIIPNTTFLENLFNITNTTNQIPIYQTNQTYQPTPLENDSNTSGETKKIPAALLIIIGVIVIITFGLMKLLSFGNKPKKPVITETKPKFNPKWRK